VGNARDQRGFWTQTNLGGYGNGDVLIHFDWIISALYYHQFVRGENMPKIFIDPGHGGRDSGAVANGLMEKSITLYIALRMKYILEDEYTNGQVKLSREKDVYVGLSERAQMANAWGADYFVSIHVNAGGGTGFESYVHSSRPSRTVAY